MKSNFKSTFGGELRDNVMQFQLDNEVGSLLKIEKDKENGTVEISLLSKNNFDLGHGTIDIAYSDLTSVYLNHKEKRLEFTLKDGTKVYCYLDDLYDSKQDKLISGKNISTVNDHNLLLGGDVHIPYVEKSEHNGNIILDKEELAVYNLRITINNRDEVQGNPIVDIDTNTANIPLDEDIKNDSEDISATTHAIKTYVDTNIEDTSKYFNDKIDATQFDLDNEKTNRKALAGHSISISQDKDHIVDIDLINANGESISHQEINLDAEHIIDKVDLDYANKKLIFTFKDGHKLDCDISALIDDLDRKIVDETSRAMAKEDQLQSDLDSEIARAKEREQDLNSLINSNDEKQSTNLSNVKKELIDKINNDIDALDVDKVGEDGKYLKFISEENGKIIPELNAFDTTIPEEASSINAPTTYAVKDYVDSNITQTTTTLTEKIEEVDSRLDTKIDDTDKAINNRIDSEVDTLNTRITTEVNILNTTITEKETALNKTIDYNDTKQTKNLNDTKEELTKKINNDIDALDVAQVGNDGNYIKYVSEENGKINAIPQQFDNEIDENASHNNTPSTLAIYTFVNNIIDSLDVDEVGEDNKYIKFIKEENGKIEATLNSFETLVNNENASTINAPTSKAIKDYVDSLVTSTKEGLTSTIENKYNTLDYKIDTTKSDLQTELKESLKSYYTKEEIDAQEKEINNSITYLTNTVNQNKTDINNKVDNLNTTLTKKIDDDIASTKGELKTNINNVASDLSNAKESLEAKDTELEENIGNLNTTLRSYVDTSISTLDTSLKNNIEETKEELENKINLTYEILN